MTSPEPLTPWSSTTKYLQGSVPAHVVQKEDQARLRAYDLYERMYWNEPGTFTLVKRGEDPTEIMIPSVRKIVNAKSRFLAVDFDFLVDPKLGSGGEQAELQRRLGDLFKRELVYTKFDNQKRFGMVKGDQVWHLLADDDKPAEHRLSIIEVDPANYFAITDENDPDKILGCHIAELIKDPADKKGKQVIKRQTYRKGDIGEDGLQEITTELTYWQLDAWDDRVLDAKELKPYRHAELVEIPQKVLEGIHALPVYPIPNLRMSGFAYGVSELKGFESLVAAMNQSLSDEDITLVMQGLGVYWTNAGPPTDAAGNETALEISPGVILEVPDGNTIGRLNGVSSVAPMQDHIKSMMTELQQGSGTPDIATGIVDVALAESGISLELKMAPLLAENREKERILLGVLNQMLYDIVVYWFPAFEEYNTAARATVSVGDPKPVNREAKINEIILLVTPAGPGSVALITPEMAFDAVANLGYEYPPGAKDKLLEAASKAQEVLLDPDGTRAAAENNAGSGSNPDNQAE